MTYKFYDTNSLLLKGNTLFSNLKEDESIVISSITLGELEKTPNIRYGLLVMIESVSIH